MDSVAKRYNQPIFRESFEERELFLNEDLSGAFSISLDDSKHYEPIHIFGLVDRNVVPPIFRALKYSTHESGEKLAFLDTFVELSYDADARRIQDISGREIESFLRDGTGGAAFSSQHQLIPLLDSLKKKLQEALEGKGPRAAGDRVSPTISEHYTPSDPPLFSSDVGAYVDLSFEQKMNLVQEIIQKYIAAPLHEDGGSVSPVFVDGSLIVVEYLGACAQCLKSQTSTMDFIQRVLQLETKEDQLRVITDS